MFQRRLTLPPAGQGLHDVTAAIAALVREAGHTTGLCHVFVQHTSASLLIQENADPQVQRDLQAWLTRLAPEGDPLFGHVEEGPDDMPAHVRSAITATGLTIPIVDGRLGLGTWQGIYLWEHRRRARGRSLVVTIW
jgi:secondary thiamine-phosphate synthase enzyme